MSEWLGASWETIGFVALSTFAMYSSALIALRVAGRRTLSQMSAFDFLVTVAIGTLVSSTAVSRDPSYVQGLAALVTLLLLQLLVASLRSRVGWLSRYLDFRPTILFEGGQMTLRSSPLTAQVTGEELMSKLRQQGMFDLEDVRLVILEPDGRLSVVRKDAPEGETLEPVRPRWKQ